MSFTYNKAIVCRDIPKTLVNGLSSDPNHEPVDAQKASIQHQVYLNTLKTNGIELISIEPDDNYPDCVFVEDVAISIGNKILITNPGAPSRQGETKKMSDLVGKLGNNNLIIHQMNLNEDAYVDGGDCCFTGKELLVGLSKRTNLKGIGVLKEFFSDIEIIPIEVTDGLHLKSIITMCKVDSILMGNSDVAKKIKEQIIEKSKFSSHYKFITIGSDDLSCSNVLYFNNILVYPHKYSNLYENHPCFKEVNKIPIENGEFSKIDGALTCRSVLLNF
jgi:dimethylargininase